MKMNLLKAGGTLMLAAMLWSGCKKDNNNGKGAAGAQLFMGVKADNAAATLTGNATTGGLSTQASASAAAITWTSAVANISGFKLEAKKRGVEIEIKSQNMATVNLFAPVPAVISAAVDTGTYTQIEIKALLIKTTGTDIPLTLKGTFTTAGGAVVPIELDFNDDAIIKAEAENVVVDGTKDLTNIISIHLNKLLNNITPASIDAATRTGGTILISNNVNAGIYSKIKDNIGTSGSSNGFEKHDR